jgi:hypothetical protein
VRRPVGLDGIAVIETAMPYKANADRRHRGISTARDCATKWRDYDAALIRWGSLTLWVTEEALAAGMRLGAVSVAVGPSIPTWR